MLGKAGDGVDLVKDDFLVGGDEEIHTRKATAGKGLVKLFGDLLDLLGKGFGNTGGNMHGGVDVGVFFGEIKEGAVGFDLCHLANQQFLIAKHGTADLKALNALLHEDVVVKLEGKVYGIAQILRTADYC